jgi:predicted dehydrogenase
MWKTKKFALQLWTLTLVRHRRSEHGNTCMTRITRRSFLGGSAGLGAALLTSRARGQGANERLNVGFIGTGARGTNLLKQFSHLPDVRIAAICDPDAERLDRAAASYPGANKYADLRRLLDDRDVDAVAIATCNHWHALAAIWACRAGKDVFVEKPLAHTLWEGQQIVRAARKFGRIVQVGMQQRSDPVQEELKHYLHVEKALGAIKHVLACQFARRKSIGRRATPLTPPASVNYDLWLGPAFDQPIYRDALQYDWNWDWNTGNGELGNWSVHMLDDAINVVLRDQVRFPTRVAVAAGRVVWDDAGETPNVCFAHCETESIPVLYAMSNLPNGLGGWRDMRFKGIRTGYVVQCEGGYYAGGRGGGAAYDNNGRQLRRFRGDAGAGHAQNFVDAVHARDQELLHADVETGHQSSAWCHLLNAVTRAAGGDSASAYSGDAARAVGSATPAWDDVVGMMEAHLANNSVEADKAFRLSRVFEFDGGREQFRGEGAGQANQFLRHEYRPGYEVPTVV